MIMTRSMRIDHSNCGAKIISIFLNDQCNEHNARMVAVTSVLLYVKMYYEFVDEEQHQVVCLCFSFIFGVLYLEIELELETKEENGVIVKLKVKVYFLQS